jgi:hypothetical protein
MTEKEYDEWEYMHYNLEKARNFKTIFLYQVS